MDKLVPAAPADAAKKRRAIMVALGGESMDLVMPTTDYQINCGRIEEDGRLNFRVSHRFAVRIKRVNSGPVITLPF